MSTTIIYMSKHGTTAKIAELIKSNIDSEVQLYNLKNFVPKDLNVYDTIIIGGSIHAGSMQSKLRKYMTENLNLLLQKRIALFMICMQKDEKREEQFINAFPQELRDISITNGFMGGEFNFDKMNFIEKAIIKKISGKSFNVSEIDNDAIEEFVSKLKENNQ